jgi:two-component system LytT family response regulator
MIQAFVLDDEPLAVRRLSRMLEETGRVEIAGASSDPVDAVEWLSANKVDVLFLDIQMPGMDGFEALSMLNPQPLVVFTTAYDQYALQAFEVNSIDYLLKPIEPEQLERALHKLDRLRPATKPDWQQKPDVTALLQEMAATLRGERPEFPRRIATRVGERISFLDLDQVTHVMASDKLTYAVVNGRQHCVDQTVSDLEQRLDPAHFLRIHRAVLVNVNWIQELNSWFGGKVVVTLKDAQHTQLTVARDRVRALKSRLGIHGS